MNECDKVISNGKYADIQHRFGDAGEIDSLKVIYTKIFKKGGGK